MPPKAYRALKTYQCGEPKGSKHKPPPKIEKLMVEHLGPHSRIFAADAAKGRPAGLYVNFHPSLLKALSADKAIEEA